MFKNHINVKKDKKEHNFPTRTSVTVNTLRSSLEGLCD